MLRMNSLTYTSVARPGLGPSDIRAIHETARHLNALDGVTGLLIYNGHQFLQVIEGAESAIGDLLLRLREDTRHSGLRIVDQRVIEKREFRHWAMELAQITVGDAEDRSNLDNLLPATLPNSILTNIAEMRAARA